MPIIIKEENEKLAVKQVIISDDLTKLELKLKNTNTFKSIDIRLSGHIAIAGDKNIARDENIPECEFKYGSLNKNDLSITLVKRKRAKNILPALEFIALYPLISSATLAKAKIHFNAPSELTTVQNSKNNSPVSTDNAIASHNSLQLSPKSASNQNLLFNKNNNIVSSDSKNLPLEDLPNQKTSGQHQNVKTIVQI